MINKAKQIKIDTDFSEFAINYQAISGNIITVQELRRRTYVGALFDQDGEMCAGFTVNCEQPLVYLSDLPQAMTTHTLCKSKNDMVEGGSIWVKDNLSDFTRGYVFLVASWRAYAMKKRYYMAGARNSKIAKRQKFLFPNVLFEGKTEKFDYLCVLYCRREYIFVQIGLILLRYWCVQPFKKWMSGVKGIAMNFASKF
ncbi:hypothetical protein F0225_09835 [Vibrio pectenicida]|uniref:Uncharacterized protein n=1 Tax=Vibrio pectenicida TaxID=62763 RepID=A0A7Y4A024_9VIBR|nr:hypothetical protein [Vibrio pectenicida]NOH71634.1 hypothetical protein [Vibrio pectenicida]